MKILQNASNDFLPLCEILLQIHGIFRLKKRTKLKCELNVFKYKVKLP